MSQAKMEEGLRLFLEGLGERFPAAREGGDWPELLSGTPRRVARAWLEDIAAGYDEDPARWLEPIEIEEASGPVVLSGIRFHSICAHHLLPYRGEAIVGFQPGRWHVGLGSIARAIDSLARRLTLQEQLTAGLAGLIEEALAPKSAVVAIEAEHMCLSVRGARKTGHRFRTVERRGERDPELERLILGQ